jgi:hypothetical protein
VENFLFKIGKLQLNSCNKYLLSEGEHTTGEISLWHDDECKTSRHTIAYYVKSDNVYDLKLISDRVYSKDVDRDSFIYLAEMGYNLLLGNTED